MVRLVSRVLLVLRAALVLRAQRVIKVILAWRVLGVKLVTLEKGVFLALWGPRGLKDRWALTVQLELKENVALQE
jgi:hypothetical protein